MNWKTATELVGLIGIVVSVLYLAIQTTQNTEALQAGTRQAMLEAEQELLLHMSTYPELNYLFCKPDLTLEERSRFHAWLSAYIRARESNWLQFQAGSIDARTWDAYRQTLGLLMSFTNTRPWWNAARSVFGWDPQFTAEGDAILAQTPIVTDCTLDEFFPSHSETEAP